MGRYQDALSRINAERETGGRKPLSGGDAGAFAFTAATRKPATPLPKPKATDVLGNIARNVNQMVDVIGAAPRIFQQEVDDIVNIDKRLAEVRTPGDIANLPIIRLLPGAYVAGGLLPGGTPAGDLLANPVFTALDVLPYAHGAAKSLGKQALVDVAKTDAKIGTLTGAREAKNAVARVGLEDLPLKQKVGLSAAKSLGEGTRVLPDLLFKKFNEAGDTVLRDPFESFRTTKTGQLVNQFSNQVRRAVGDIKRIELSSSQDIGQKAGAASQFEAFSGGVQLDKLIQQAAKDSKVGPIREQYLRDLAERPISTAGVSHWSEADDLSNMDRSILSEAERLSEQLEVQKTSDMAGVVDQFIERDIRGDVRIVDEARRTRAAKDRADNSYFDSSNFIERKAAKAARVDHGITEATWKNLPGDQKAALMDSSPSYIQLRELSEKLDTVYQMRERYIDDPSLNPEQYKAALEDVKNWFKQTPPKGLTTKEWSSVQARVSKRKNNLVQLAQKDFQRMQLKPADAYMPELRRRYADQVIENYRRAQDVIDPGDAKIWQEEYEQFGKEQRRQFREDMKEKYGDDYNLLNYQLASELPSEIHNFDYHVKDLFAGFMAKGEITRLMNEIKGQWRDVRANSKPVYIPRVTAENIKSVNYLTIEPKYMTPKFARKMTFDYTPATPNMGLSISYGAFEDFMARQTVPEVVENLVQTMGKSTQDVYDMYTSMAQRRRRNINPGEDTHKYVEKKMAAGWVEFDPQSFFNFKTLKGNQEFKDILIPREVEKVFKQLFTPDNRSFLNSGAIGSVNDIFRASVLAFSPRWHWYNLLGGMAMMTIHNPKAWLEIPKVWNDFGGSKGMFYPTREPHLNFDDAGRIVETAKPYTKPQRKYTPEEEGARFAGITGSYERDLLNPDQSAKWLDSKMAGAKSLRRIWDGIQTTKQYSLDANAFLDDVVRAADFRSTYKSELDSLLKEGIPSGEAHVYASERALKSAQEVLMSWNQMLPIERSVLRTVFPFYGWISHIMRMAMTMPFDHPTRMAVVAAFARNEQIDAATGIPELFRSLFFFGDPRKQERTTGFNIGGAVPFKDVGDFATMAGWIGASSPLIQRGLKIMGVDVRSGGPEMYPNLAYDQNTGQVVANTGNPLLGLATDVIPQSKLITAALGINEEYNNMVKYNKAAADRYLLSNGGLPILWRDVDTGVEFGKEELQRRRVAKNVLQNANSSGNTSELERWPSLSPLTSYIQMNNRYRQQGRPVDKPAQMPADFSIA